MAKRNINRILTSIIFLISSAFITSYSSVVNALSGDNSNDSWIFRYMGMLIDKGGVPYKDAFEQKGPLLFFIQYAGYKINRDYGIWIIEIISMTLVLYFTYLLCKRFTAKIQAVVCAIVSISSISIFFYGNNCEEYALPFIALSTFIFTDYFIYDKCSGLRLFLCGLSCAAVFMLRPNMLSLWVVMSIAVIIRYIKDLHKFPVIFSLLFSSGFFSVIVPIFFWYYSKGGLNDLIDQYFIFNFNYTEDVYTISKHIGLMLSFAGSSLLLIPILILIITALDPKYRYYNITFLVYIVLNILLCTISVRGYLHYGMPLILCHAYPLALLTKKLSEKKYKIYQKVPCLLYIVYSFTLIIFCVKNCYSFVQTIYSYNRPQHELDLISEVRELSKETDTILVLGNGARLYYEADRLSSSKYFIQVPIYAVNSNLKVDIKEDINRELPVLLVDHLMSEDESDEYGQLFDHYDKYTPVDNINRLFILKQ